MTSKIFTALEFVFFLHGPCFRRSRSFALALALVAQTSTFTAFSKEHNPDTNWLRDAHWGLFAHYLWDLQNVGSRPNTMGRPVRSWDEVTREFDTERFAEQVKTTGAGYVIFTTMQRSRYLIAPNATFDKLTHYQPGEACSTRDLVLDLHASLAKRGIKLMLYWTGDGPREDVQAATGLGGWSGQVNDQYVHNWASVAAEYSRRYGSKISGWWVDGSYRSIGYNEERLGIVAAALKSGNARSIIAFNDPTTTHASSTTKFDDYTAGELYDLKDFPNSRWRDGKQYHVLTFLGNNWASPDCRFSLDSLASYVYQVNEFHGVVTFDVAVFRDGSLATGQTTLLSSLTGALRQIAVQRQRDRTIPRGNWAFRKPAKLLSVDGLRSLSVNGGNSRLHPARYGVDGNVGTDAEAAGEIAWSYEVDLQTTVVLGRIVVTFGAPFANDFEVSLSVNHRTWKRLALVENRGDVRWEEAIAPTTARYIRVRALERAAQDHKGGQMSIAELEVYSPAQQFYNGTQSSKSKVDKVIR